MTTRPTAANMKALQDEIDVLKKDLAKEKEHKDMYARQAQERQSEIDQVHMLLDAMPVPPSRESTADRWGYTKSLSLMTRLAAYLAAR